MQAVLESCVETGFFDAPLFENAHVLTSRRIQRNYNDATRKRAEADIAPQLNLLAATEEEEPDTDGNPASMDGNPRENDGNPAATDGNPRESGVQSTQIKEHSNQTKPEESKTHQSTGGSAVPQRLVSLSNGERAELTAEFGEAAVKRMIEMLGSYKGASGKEYKSDYCAIRSWVVKRWREENASALPGAPRHFRRGAVRL